MPDLRAVTEDALRAEVGSSDAQERATDALTLRTSGPTADAEDRSASFQSFRVELPRIVKLARQLAREDSPGRRAKITQRGKAIRLLVEGFEGMTTGLAVALIDGKVEPAYLVAEAEAKYQDQVRQQAYLDNALF